MTRVWCLFELSCSNKTLEIALSGDQLQSFYSTLRRDWEEIIASLCVIDLEKATSFSPEDKDRIFEVIRDKGGFHSFNVRVVAMLREWVATATRRLVGVGMGSPVAQDVTVEGDMSANRLKDFGRAANLLMDQGQWMEA